MDKAEFRSRHSPAKEKESRQEADGGQGRTGMALGSLEYADELTSKKPRAT